MYADFKVSYWERAIIPKELEPEVKEAFKNGEIQSTNDLFKIDDNLEWECLANTCESMRPILGVFTAELCDDNGNTIEESGYRYDNQIRIDEAEIRALNASSIKEVEKLLQWCVRTMGDTFDPDLNFFSYQLNNEPLFNKPLAIHLNQMIVAAFIECSPMFVRAYVRALKQAKRESDGKTFSTNMVLDENYFGDKEVETRFNNYIKTQS